MKSWFSRNRMVIIATVFLVFIVTMIVYSSMANKSTPNTNAGKDKGYS